MCRNIKTLHNFEPPATDEEVRAAALQYVRKVSGSAKPSKANEAVFARAVDEIADEYGWPIQQRGATAHEGLYFVGVNWLHKRKSALLCGVGEDAEHVVTTLVDRS